MRTEPTTLLAAGNPNASRTTAGIIGVALTASIVAIASPNAAHAAAPDDKLVAMVQQYLAGENALVVVDSSANITSLEGKKELSRRVSGTTWFNGQRAQRVKARQQERELNALGDVHFSDALTSVTLLFASPGTTTRVLEVEETTSHPFSDGGAAPYAYKLRHRVAFEQTASGWAIASIETDDPLKLNERSPKSVKQFEETKELTKELLVEAQAARDVRRATNEEKAQHDQTPASVPGTCYTCAANWAIKYAVAPPAVDYTRDANDCTTFVSFAMSHGGWPEVPGLWNSKSAWWYNCDWCKPRHSYAWGGANNFKTFVTNSGRVSFLSNVWYVGLADIIQYDVKNYGGTGTADHTMIVTAFDGSGRPLLSYHSSDTRNKPLIQILQSAGAVGQTFWAERT